MFLLAEIDFTQLESRTQQSVLISVYETTEIESIDRTWNTDTDLPPTSVSVFSAGAAEEDTAEPDDTVGF